MASVTPSARARFSRFLREGFRRASSMPARYTRWICASSARRSCDQPFLALKCRMRWARGLAAGGAGGGMRRLATPRSSSGRLNGSINYKLQACRSIIVRSDGRGHADGRWRRAPSLQEWRILAGAFRGLLCRLPSLLARCRPFIDPAGRVPARHRPRCPTARPLNIVARS